MLPRDDKSKRQTILFTVSGVRVNPTYISYMRYIYIFPKRARYVFFFKATSWLIHPSWLNAKDRVSLLDALSQDEKTSTAQVGRGENWTSPKWLGFTVGFWKMAWNGTLKVCLFEKFEGHSGPSFCRVSVRIIVVHILSSWTSRTDPRSACMCSRGACSSCTLF